MFLRAYLRSGLLADARTLDRSRRALLALIGGVVAAGFALHLVRDGLAAGDLAGTVLPPDALHDALEVAAGLSCLLRAAWVARDRRAWLLLGVGVSLYAVGDTLWFAWLGRLEDAPFPSLSDAFWLSFYVVAMLAIALLVRARGGVSQTTLWLDGVMGAFVVSAVGIAVLSAHGFLDVLADESAVVAAVNLAYPILDLSLLAAVVATFALTGWRPGRMWALLGTGLVLLAVADTAFIYMSAEDAVDIGLLRPMYALAMILVGVAAWQEPKPIADVDMGSVRVLALPSAFVVAATGLLGVAAFRPVSAVAVALALAALAGVVVRTGLTFRDLRAFAQTRHEALTDELTGLPNRRMLYRSIDAALAEDDDRARLGLLLVDLDRFKELNDTLGHAVGDTLLEEVGARLRDALGEAGMLARLGGDEFAALLTGPVDASTVAAAAGRLREALAAPVLLEGIALHVDASVGGALAPDHGTDISSLLRHADVAMYQAKAARTGFQLYRAAANTNTRERLALVGELRMALRQRQLVVHYQPKAALATGAVTGVEALVRWQHPERGLLAPAEFLPAAEGAGLIGPLTFYVLDEALADCARWRRRGLDLSVAVNLSALNLLDAGLPAEVEAVLARHGVPPDRLRLEVTENIVMTDPARAEEVLTVLRGLGVRVALDDFGTGHASLAYLKHLPVDELKVDRSFVTGMRDDARNAAIVRAIVDLARNLGLRVVAEGVEHADEWDDLTEYGCDEAQGYLLSRPVAAPALEALLAVRRAA
jgi:diguanylate cyclase (GGDEF)-like protein